jgi:hypothetical protein
LQALLPAYPSRGLARKLAQPSYRERCLSDYGLSRCATRKTIKGGAVGRITD